MLGTRSVDGRRARAASTGPADQAVARRRASAAVETTNRRAHGLRVAAVAGILQEAAFNLASAARNVTMISLQNSKNWEKLATSSPSFKLDDGRT